MQPLNTNHYTIPQILSFPFSVLLSSIVHLQTVPPLINLSQSIVFKTLLSQSFIIQYNNSYPQSLPKTIKSHPTFSITFNSCFPYPNMSTPMNIQSLLPSLSVQTIWKNIIVKGCKSLASKFS